MFYSQQNPENISNVESETFYDYMKKFANRISMAKTRVKVGTGQQKPGKVKGAKQKQVHVVTD